MTRQISSLVREKNEMTKLLLILMVVVSVGRVWGDEPEIKIWTKNNPNGTIKEQYQYYNHPENNKRIKHGWYNSYQKNGEYSEIGIYDHDKRHGEWTSYHKNGRVLSKTTIDRGKIEGKYVWYGEDGSVSRSSEYQNGELHGSSISYYSRGKVRTETTYKDGKRDGQDVMYYRNGQVTWSTSYKNDKLHGKSFFYNQNGQLVDEDDYLDGRCVKMCEGYCGDDLRDRFDFCEIEK